MTRQIVAFCLSPAVHRISARAAARDSSCSFWLSSLKLQNQTHTLKKPTTLANQCTVLQSNSVGFYIMESIMSLLGSLTDGPHLTHRTSISEGLSKQCIPYLWRWTFSSLCRTNSKYLIMFTWTAIWIAVAPPWNTALVTCVESRLSIYLCCSVISE